MDSVIAQLRELNESVAKPLRLPSLDEVELVEKQLSLTFHNDYRRFLLEASDVVFGTIEPATIPEDSGHTYIVDIVKAARQNGVCDTLLPIAEDNGDFYCMNELGEVVFWCHDGVANEKWPNLATWIQEVWLDEG